MMKIIETEAIEPQPVRKEGERSEVHEVFIFDTYNHFIGTEWRIKSPTEEITDG
jgi:hypothetical protein